MLANYRALHSGLAVLCTLAATKQCTVFMDWDISVTGLNIMSETWCGKKPSLWTTHPVADLALEVAAG